MERPSAVGHTGPVTDAASNALVRTRSAWHAVAELVLAGPQYRRTGGIALRVVPDGFATTRGLELQVVGGHLLMPEVSVPLDGRTCRELATAAGVEVGEPADLYHDGSRRMRRRCCGRSTSTWRSGSVG